MTMIHVVLYGIQELAIRSRQLYIHQDLLVFVQHQTDIVLLLVAGIIKFEFGVLKFVKCVKLEEVASKFNQYAYIS